MAAPKKEKTTSGVDMKADSALNLHDQMLTLLTKNQGQTELDDDYFNGFN